jgi:hypothetical protein
LRINSQRRPLRQGDDLGAEIDEAHLVGRAGVRHFLEEVLAVFRSELPAEHAGELLGRSYRPYSSFRLGHVSLGGPFGVRSARKLKYGATNGSGADTVYVW